MLNRLILQKKYSSVVVINYIKGTPILLTQCLYDLWKTNGDNIDCVVVSINDIWDYPYSEEIFFRNLLVAIDKRFDLYYFNNGGKKESEQKAFLFSELIDQGIERIIYLHEDCYIQQEDLLKSYLDGLSDKRVFCGRIFQKEGCTTGEKYLFSLHREISRYIPISSPTTWKSQELPIGGCVKEGLGLIAFFANNNPDRYYEINSENFVSHRGNIVGNYRLREDNYNLKNTLKNFFPSIEWFCNRQLSPSFFESNYAKQIAYIIDLRRRRADCPIKNHTWISSQDVDSINTISYLAKG